MYVSNSKKKDINEDIGSFIKESPKIELLPDDTIIHVFKYLYPREVFSVSIASKKWSISKLAKHERIWKEIYKFDVTDPVYEIILKNNKHLQPKAVEKSNTFYSSFVSLNNEFLKGVVKVNDFFFDVPKVLSSDYIKNFLFKEMEKSPKVIKFLKDKCGKNKFVMVGNVGVGKTCTYLTIAQNEFPQQNVPDIFHPYTGEVKICGKYYCNWFPWDTAGSIEYDVLRLLSYQDVDSFLLLFSVVDKQSYQDVYFHWVKELRGVFTDDRGVRKYAHRGERVADVDLGIFEKNRPIILVGTKIDLREDTRKNGGFVCDFQMGKKLAKKIGAITYLEISSKEMKNTKRFFEMVISLRAIYETYLLDKKKKDKSKCIIQ